ncbi:MAG: hypothetical protein E6248_16420 [Clostridium sp.]|uniref:hypothetical protein n=1 Tax=Clostridium sp. TaxID=1506 RepID=UPI0029115A93|nr:hypothetical protein [Clostridium sp.]MDU5112016.1 hypothetical protein [Clostridium sp.]
MNKKRNIDKEDLMWRIAAGCVLLIVILSYYFLKINYTSRGMINNYLNKRDGKILTEKLDKKIKSGNLSTDYEIDKTLEDIELLGLNTINLPIVININDLTSSDVSIDSNSLQRAKWLLDKLKGKGINIILEPYPWISNGSKYETEYNPNYKDAFFNNWKNNVLKPLIDEIAIPYRVDALNIATGFNNLEQYETEFSDMIDFTRKYYKGLITYRTSYWTTANWNDESTNEQVSKLDENYYNKLNNSIFSKLDFI